MMKNAMLAAALVAATLPTLAVAKEKAPAAKADVAKPAAEKGPGCRSIGWSTDAASKAIIQTETDQRYILTASQLSPNTQMVVAYKLANHTGGEVLMGRGQTELVEGSTITVQLSGSARPSASGTYRLECKAAK